MVAATRERTLSLRSRLRIWTFTVCSEIFNMVTDLALGSDAFFPFGDNVERAARSGVTAIAQPGGSIRDDNVIETADKYGMVMCFTGIRLFHH